MRAILALAAAAAVVAGCGSSGQPAASTTAPDSPVPTSASPSASPSRSTVAPAARTTIRFALATGVDCEDGSIGAYNTTLDSLWEKRIGLEGGAATLTVPVDLTRGMSFDIRCDGWPGTGAVSAIVLQYEGAQPGEVPATDAAGMPTATRASWCWAGTTDEQVDVGLQTYLSDGDGSPTGGVAAVWTVPTLATTASTDGARWQDTYSGMLGHQDAPYC